MSIKRVLPALPVIAVILAASGCSAATYEERMGYLRKVAQQGAETYQLLTDQQTPVINADRCSQAWDGLKRPGEFPSDIANVDGYKSSNEWAAQIRQFFVDSCVSGKPKPVPGDPHPSAPSIPSSSPSSPTTPTST